MVHSPANEPKMRFERVRISPDIASEWLTRIPENQRNIRPSTVKKYASDMMTLKWVEESPEVIAVGVDGSVLNGQHRLHAIKESGVTLTLWVAFNVPISAYKVFDMGVRRSPGDTARAIGVRFDSHDLAIARAAYSVDNRGANISQLFIIDIATVLRGHIRAIREALGGKGFTSAITGAGVLAMFRSSVADQERIVRFFRALSTGIPTCDEETIATQFLAWTTTAPVTREYGTTGRLKIFRVAQKTIKAYLAGEKISKFYIPSGDVFVAITRKEIEDGIDAINRSASSK